MIPFTAEDKITFSVSGGCFFCLVGRISAERPDYPLLLRSFRSTDLPFLDKIKKSRRSFAFAALMAVVRGQMEAWRLWLVDDLKGGDGRVAVLC